MTTLTNRLIRFITASALGLGLLWSAPSHGAPPNTISNSVAVCDPWNPQLCSRLGPGTRNFPGCTVGAASGQCLAASTAQNFLQIQNTSTNNIACAFGATAVLNSATSVQLSPGQAASWGPVTGGVPSQALNCIASGAGSPLYVEWY